MNINHQKPDAERTTRLAEAYLDALPRLRRLRGPKSPDAEDIAQESFVRVLQVKEPSTLGNPARYLMRVARNLFVDELRSAARMRIEPNPSSDRDLSAEDTLDPERILNGKQELEIVLAAIEALPPRCREAFKLRRFEELSHAAIARRMGISTRMVELHIAEAMLKLSRALSAAGEHFE